jgi:hypothetical protein
MAGTTPTYHVGQPGCDDLTSRLFRAMYRQFDLRTIGDTYIVVPTSISWYSCYGLEEIPRQISGHEHLNTTESSPGATAAPAGTGQAG